MRDEATHNPGGWPSGDGEMARRIRVHDWAATPLGPTASWPQSWRTTVDLILALPGPATILWGPDHVQIYNDAYIPIARDRHPALLGRPVAEGWADIYETVLVPLLDAAQAGQATRLTDFAVPLEGASGQIEERVFDSDWSPLRDETGAVAGALQTLVETTERRSAQTALRDSEARHRLLIERWAQAVWETNADGVVTADSPSWRAYTGQTLDEWLGYGWLDAIHPDDRAYAERQWREAVAARAPVDAEFSIRSAEGGWRWTNVRAAPVLDDAGRIEKWAGMNIDIDARKSAESALRDSEERYRNLFNSIDEGFCVIEVIFGPENKPVDYVFRETNQSFERQTGLVDARGKRMRELAPEHEQHWFDIYGQIALTGEPHRFEQRAAALGRWYDVYAFRIGDPDDRQVAILFNDTTGRKRAEAELRAREERQGFLIELGDAMRSQTSAEGVVETAARLLGLRLNASRVAFGEFDDEHDLVHIRRSWTADGAETHPAILRQSDFVGPLLDDLRAGRTVRFDNVGEPPYARPELEQLAAIGVRAALSVPVIDGGRLVLNLMVHNHAPYCWTDEEVALAQETAERTWAAVERARAEAALRASADYYRFILGAFGAATSTSRSAPTRCPSRVS
jgi:PAS domain S-box-containing protein